MSADPPIRRPAVAALPGKTPVARYAMALALLGGGTMLWLANARAAQANEDGALPMLGAVQVTTPAALPRPPSEPPAEPAPPVPAPKPAPNPPALATESLAASSDMRQRLRAPALIVDLAQANVPAGAQPRTDGASAGMAAAAAPAAAGGDGKSSADDLFTSRLSGSMSDVTEAERMSGLDRVIPEGAIIAAVMETALNSDLPGFARALIQRDVYSFDGSAVLIPAGSRVVGQYKSAVAQGASRVFIIWTRVIRPDGVSIGLASPAVDDLGRGGVAGKVNRHFFQRFGGAILMSVLTGGINAAAASAGGGSTVVVGTSSEATSLARSAGGDSQIPPTITTPQGAPVRIFVSRDLDFTKVGPYQ